MHEILGIIQPAIVASRGELDALGVKSIREGIATILWHMPVNMDPMLYAVALQKPNPMKALLEESGSFSINFLDEKDHELASICHRDGPRLHEPFKALSIPSGECTAIDCPYLEHSLLHLECTVHSIIDLPDHFLIIGQVEKQQNNNKGKRLVTYHADDPAG